MTADPAVEELIAEARAHARSLRSLGAWMTEHDLDMRCPRRVKDPEATALCVEALIEALTTQSAALTRLEARLAAAEDARDDYRERLHDLTSGLVGMKRAEPDWRVLTLTYETSAQALVAHGAITAASASPEEAR
jgi:hypothetical protein